jgi:hypothetical protein
MTILGEYDGGLSGVISIAECTQLRWWRRLSRDRCCKREFVDHGSFFPATQRQALIKPQSHDPNSWATLANVPVIVNLQYTNNNGS